MNPAKASTFAEKADFRQQYMTNLQLSIANDTLNSNANRYYDRTNDILTQPSDTRNAEEKLADIQNLKNFILKSLQNKTPNPVSFISRLSDEDVEYVAQNINRIIDIMNKKYAVGVPFVSIMPLLQQLKDEDGSYQDIKNLATGRIAQQKEFFTQPKRIPAPAIIEGEEPDFSVNELIQQYKDMGGTRQTHSITKRATIVRYIEELQGGTGKGIVGRGLHRPKSKVSLENIDFSKSIEPIKSYIPFGRYVLNRHKLNDNILMIKHMKGGAIGTIPTSHISSGLSKALKHFVDTQLPPNYDMISDLSKEDKEMLHKVAKQAHLLDKMNVPTPNLTEEEQENHRFDILKGEINAGNDAKDVIKEFKLLLLKFIHKNKLPRRQAQEILLDLIALGY